MDLNAHFAGIMANLTKMSRGSEFAKYVAIMKMYHNFHLLLIQILRYDYNKYFLVYLGHR